MKTLVVLQPGYLPWLGFFDQLLRSDVFVYYDDVQFDKQGWRNRNRIKGPDGPVWLSVPVLQSGRFGQSNMEVEIDNRQPWARKHIATIRQLYARAPFLDQYLPPLESLLAREWRLLVDLDLAVTDLIRGWLGIEREIFRASQLNIGGSKSERLVNMCLHFKAGRYLSGDAAQEYLDAQLFARSKIEVIWQNYRHPVYSQLHGNFTHFLSILDLILNVGPDSRRVLEATA